MTQELEDELPEDKFDYDKDMHIDQSALDVEWLDQPKLMIKYSRALAKANREVSRLKEKMKVERAKLNKDIRSSPAKYGLEDIKITEASINGALDTHKIMIAFEYEKIDAEYEAEMVKGAVDAVKQRKDALQDLVKLHGQQYFAGPSIPRDLGVESAKRKMERSASNSVIKIKPRRK